MPSVCFISDSGNKPVSTRQWISARKDDLCYKGWSFSDSDEAELIVSDSFDASSVKFLRKAVKTGKMTVFHFHPFPGNGKINVSGTSYTACQERALKKMISSAGMVTAPTETSAEYLERIFPSASITVVPESEVLPAIYPDPKSARAFRLAFGFSETDKIVLSVDPCNDPGGILELVELARTLPELHFLRFGDLKLLGMSNKVRKTILKEFPNLHVMGELSPEIMQGAFSACDAFLSLAKVETSASYAYTASALGLFLLFRDVSFPSFGSSSLGDSCACFSTVEQAASILIERNGNFPKQPSVLQNAKSMNEFYRGLL